MHNDEIGIVTRSGGSRLRWLAAAVAVPLFGVVTAFGTVEHVPEPIPVRTVIEPLAPSATSVGDSGTIIYFREDRVRRGRSVFCFPGRRSKQKSTRSAGCARYRFSPTGTRFSRWIAWARASAD